MKKSVYILFLILSTLACQPVESEQIEEDYEALFPWKGIEEAENSYENMSVRSLDPNLRPTTYRYNGVSIPEARDYEVTIKCTYTLENAYGGAFIVLRYVGEDKKLKTVSSDIRDKEADAYFKDKAVNITLRVKSGYPMLLNLVGKAERGVSVQASISAQSVDGVIKVPKLQTVQNQNKEGTNDLPEQYCKYIILP